jgi:hypothetical protein
MIGHRTGLGTGAPPVTFPGLARFRRCAGQAVPAETAERKAVARPGIPSPFGLIFEQAAAGLFPVAPAIRAHCRDRCYLLAAPPAARIRLDAVFMPS